MDFQGFYRNHIYETLMLIQVILQEQRCRRSLLFFISSFLVLILTMIVHTTYYNNVEAELLILKAHTDKLKHRLETRQHYAHIPKFQMAISTLGGYTHPLSETDCLSNMSGCFLQKTKPQVSVEITKQEIQPSHTLQSVEIQFKSSFDYEMFDVMEYILSHSIFGYTRLRSLEIEQLFEETSNQVKGRFVYDQLSLMP